MEILTRMIDLTNLSNNGADDRNGGDVDTKTACAKSALRGKRWQ